MENKVVLITGCSSGMGFQTALKFARDGYTTIASVRDIQSTGARELIKIKNKEKLPLEVIKIDVTDDKSVSEGVKQATKLAKVRGKIDILINNAGFGYLGPIEDFTIDEIKNQYETNIFGVVRMVKAVAPIMRRQNGHGRDAEPDLHTEPDPLIINLSSIAGIVPFPLFSIYSSSKFAIETLSEGMRFELSHFGIKVVIVEPGSFATNFVKNRKYPKAFHKKNSVYQKLTENFFARYEKTHDKNKISLMNKVSTCEKVVDLIYEIAHTKNPKIRYMVGNDAYLYYFLRKLLPSQVWEWLLHKVYKW